MKKLFIDFLKDKKIYEEFVGCVVLNKERSEKYIQTRNYQDVFKLGEYDYILMAFEWEVTSYGGVFWCEINNDWREVLREEKAKPCFIKYNGIRWSGDTVRNILDKQSEE